MRKYGTIENGELIISRAPFDGCKPVVYEAIPEFDQVTQYVREKEITEHEDHIFVAVEVCNLEQDEGLNDEGYMHGADENY